MKVVLEARDVLDLLIAAQAPIRVSGEVVERVKRAVADQPYPVDDGHALLAGAVWGALQHASVAEDGAFHYDPHLVDDLDGNHLCMVEVIAPSGTYLVRVEKITGPRNTDQRKPNPVKS